jgi:hypothetical protein
MNNNISIKVTDECIESQYLLSPLSPNKSHTLVLDIDETLLSVRRWIDETQINDRVLYNKNKTQKIFKIIKITKEVTLQYDDGVVNVYSFYFNQQQPFGQLNSSLDVGDRIDIGARLASVKEVFTSHISICDEENNTIEINCLNDAYLQSLQYMSNERDNKFSKPDLVYNNMYLVRFRSGLYNFFQTLIQYENLEIILWTAAVRKVYTPLMIQVEQMLLSQINNGTQTQTNLWQNVLFRDNCSVRENGSYFKDLSLLNRNLSNLIMIDNISFNFEGFEYNGLPINEYWGHQNDQQLNKLLNILHDILCSTSAPNEDIRRTLHRLAFLYDFSTFKLDQMLKCIKSHEPEPELTDINMDFPPSSESNNYDGSDSSSSSSSSSYSNSNNTDEDSSDKNLDFYLFNFSPDIFDDDEDIDGDDNIFNDVDPTLLFNQNYN